MASPYEAPKPSEPSADDEATVVFRTSLLETWVLCSLFALAYSLYMPDIRKSPRIEEWFGGLPLYIAYVLFFAVTALVLGACLTMFGLTCIGLSPGIRKRFPITWLRRGNPPFVGAVLYLLVVVAILGSFVYLASFED